MSFGEFLIFVVILFLHATFCAAETALTGVPAARVQALADKGVRRAAVLMKLVQRRANVVAALLVGQNIVGAALAVYSTLVINSLASESIPPLLRAGIAVLLSIGLLLVFGEVIPKSLAVTSPTRFSLALAWPVLGVTLIFKPVTSVLTVLSNALLRILGGKENTSEPTLTVEEIQAIARMGHAAGTIDEIEGKVVSQAAMLNDTRVREIMVPRTDIHALEAGVTLAEIRSFFRESAYTRIPIYRRDLDDVIGILHFKEFFRFDPGRDRAFEIINYLHKPLFVPGTMFIGNLLEEMRVRRTHMAIVLDEYGGTAGLITMEDVIEMLIGRIDDEYDPVETPVRQVGEATWEVDGRVTDEQLVSQLGLQLSPEVVQGFDTVAGLALKAFGNIPAQDDVTTYHGMEITASRVTGQRVRRARIRVLPPHEAEQAEEAAVSARRKTSRTTNSVRPPSDSSDDAEPKELAHERKNAD